MPFNSLRCADMESVHALCCSCVFLIWAQIQICRKGDCGNPTCLPTGLVMIWIDFCLPNCTTELILVKCLFGCRSREGAGSSVCQINTFTDEAGNDLITLSQYTCVRVGSREGRRAREDKQSVKSLNHTHYWGDISRARILMYHEEHSLLNGHFTQFFMHFIHYSKTNFQQ